MQTAERKVDETLYKNKRISTVFLGLDHQFNEIGKPLIFETMVFPECEICERYSTWEEAEKGHKKVVAEVMGLEFQK